MSPYAYTKANNTNLLQNYAKWYGLDYTIVYFYNVYGDHEIGRGKYATVVAKFLDIVKGGHRTLPVTSPGTQLRNFTHIDDIVAGLILAGFKGSGDGYGIGSDEKYSILDLVEMLKAQPIMTESKPGNRMDGVLKTEKLKELGWSCQRSLPEYIEKKL
jgi:UDP-glucose 4-epimerase